MPAAWSWLLLTLLALAVAYAALVAALALAGRGGQARALARFVPDCAVLFARLLREPSLPRRRRLLLAGLVVYLASPIDLIPDFVPVAGQLDDAILVGLVLRSLLRSAGDEVVRRNWPGSDQSLELLLRLAGWPRGSHAAEPGQ